MQQGFVLFPDYSAATSRRSFESEPELAGSQGFGFCSEHELGVSIGRVQADMSKPSSDDVYLHARFKKVCGGGVTKKMGTDASWLRTRDIPSCRMAADDLVNSKSR
jgi:hypothetical protein